MASLHFQLESSTTADAVCSPNNTMNGCLSDSNSNGSDIPESQSSGRISILEETVKLKYEVYRYSSFSTNYVPDNILVDCPRDQSSRWSSHNNNPPQYLTLRLRRPALVRSIRFGKFEKSHVCNVKKFRIYGGMDEERMELLLESGLRNDNVPETFELRYLTEDGCAFIPILYIKVVPLLSWGPTFNYSIWYIELHGQDDPMYTSHCLSEYNKLRELEVIRLCLKHFRQQGYKQAFEALQEQTKVHLEHPCISDLHDYLVEKGDYERAEQFIRDCIDDGLIDLYLHRQDYTHNWRLQKAQGKIQPGNRGGHQLVMDIEKCLIYLYGGWNGFNDLSDLWVYDINSNSWTQLCAQSELCNGPTPRSCHKMVFDPISRNIFMLGRYLDNSIRTTEYIKSDFYMYDTSTRTWLQICDDTSQVGGPKLVYDHQICLDIEKRMIYVFGGKVLTPRSVTECATSAETEYSGLFSYHIATNTWTQLLVDCHHPTASRPDVLSIRSRVTHCMVFHHKIRKLYIYGGQRGKLDLHEFLSYDVDTQAIEFLNKNDMNYIAGMDMNDCNGHSGLGMCSMGMAPNGEYACKEPAPGYTLRATIDCDRNEIYVFSSLCKSKDRRDVQNIDMSNSFWVYSLDTNTWSRIYSYRYNTSDCSHTATQISHHKVKLLSSRNSTLEPCPRYAHQFVYDHSTKLHYLFGGNPGRSNTPQLRLDDFWILELEKPRREEAQRHCSYLIRKLRYIEMAQTEPLQAMLYLRNHIAEVIDHNDEKQLQNFHRLASLLFKSDDDICHGLDDDHVRYQASPFGMTMSLSITNNSETDFNHIEDDTDSSKNTNSSCLKIFDNENENDQSKSPNLTTKSSITIDTATSSSIRGHPQYMYAAYQRMGGKLSRREYIFKLKARRVFLFNQLVRLLPNHMVQPDRNLTDFVIL